MPSPKWQLQGFVQDSQDESGLSENGDEEELDAFTIDNAAVQAVQYDQTHVSSILGLSSSSSRTNSRSPTWISQIKAIHQSPQKKPEDDHHLAPLSDSEPLSSPPSSLGSTTSLAAPEPQTVLDNDDIDHDTHARSRALRPRNPIQLRPYLIENEIYRATFKNRGLQPVQVGVSGEAVETQDQHGESQWQEDESQDANRQPSFESSTDESVTLSPNHGHQSTPVPGAYGYRDDDDLHDFETLLFKPVVDGVQRGRKRLRTKYSKSENLPSVVAAASNYVAQTAASPVIDTVDVYDLPPSPITAVSERKKTTRRMPRVKKFHLPTQYTAANLPTPGPSSENDALYDVTMEQEFEDSPDRYRLSDSTPPFEKVLHPGGRPLSLTFDHDPVARTPKHVSTVDSNLVSSPSSPLQEDLRTQARRIRGVLPASWLRLGMPLQKPKPTTELKMLRENSPTQLPAPPLRGVAQRVVRHDTYEHKSRQMTKMTDDHEDQPLPDSDVDAADRHFRVQKHGVAGNATPVHGYYLDIEEDDWIDPMLPSAGRRRNTHIQNRGRQPKITDSLYVHSTAHSKAGRNMSTARPSSSPYVPRHQPHHSRIPLTEHSGNDQRKLLKPQALSRPTKMKDYQKASQQLNYHEFSALRSEPQHRQTKLQPVAIERTNGDTPPASRDQAKSSRIEDSRPLSPKINSLSRPGQIQQREHNHRHSVGTDDFRRQLVNLNDEFDQRVSYQQRHANPLLEKFLSPGHKTSGELSKNENKTRHRLNNKIKNGTSSERLVRHKDILFLNDISGDLVSTDLDVTTSPGYSNSIQVSSPLDTLTQMPPLKGLGPQDKTYATDYEIRPLPVGTCFDQYTFVGSGLLKRALDTGRRRIPLGEQVEHAESSGVSASWKQWTSTVAEDIQQILQNIPPGMAQKVSTCPLAKTNTIHTEQSSVTPDDLKKIIAYFANSISFSDPIDRHDCVGRMASLLQEILERLSLSQLCFESRSGSESLHEDMVSYLMLLTVLVYQIWAVAAEPSISVDLQKKLREMLTLSAKCLSKTIMTGDPARIENMLKLCESIEIGDNGFDGSHPTAETLVVLHHLVRKVEMPGLSINDLIGGALMQRGISHFENVDEFEGCWRVVFCTLPILKFDELGVILADNLSQQSIEIWAPIRMMLQRLFDLQNNSGISESSMMNKYLRVTLTRCMSLISSWGWKNSEPILGCIFDFFAKRGFGSLPHETGNHAPAFLQHLDISNDLSIADGDRAFDIFLKMLAKTLKTLREQHSDKKMKNIIWRYVPNHGRRHDKEADLREDDLEALRNQHHLLCVLYWASPPTHRIGVERIRNLVDVKTSHAALCRLSIRSWANILRFQLSVEEETSHLEAFTKWFDALLHDLIYLHQQARTEAEANFAQINKQISNITRDDLEIVIDRNEREVEALIATLLSSLSSLLGSARNKMSARYVFENIAVDDVLKWFDPKALRLGRLVTSALGIYQVYFRLVVSSPENSDSSKVNSEESQEYGDWDGIEQLADVIQLRPEDSNALETMVKQVQQVLSNLLGAEKSFDDGVLQSTVDTWLGVCRVLTELRRKTWTDLLDRHSSYSWFQFPATEHRRSLTAYFVAKAIDLDQQAYWQNRSEVLEIWLCSLLVRESALEHQHLLTNVLLSLDACHPLLQNLPFYREGQQTRFTISIAVLRQRRLSLLSSVLENMRRTLEAPPSDSTKTMPNFRHECASMLRQIMNEMKQVYRETQQTDSLRGAYIDFVQNVVGFLQQYTSEVVPVDKFFTDSALFPLPVNDPTYVVARLKSYCPNLSDERSQKKLATFLQTVSERAAIDNQQEYLAGQLAASVSGVSQLIDKSSISSTLNLRQFLLECIFPTYINTALATESGWILTLPILQASTSMFDDMLLAFSDLNQEVTKNTIARMTSAFLLPAIHAVARAACDKVLLKQANLALMLRRIYQACTSCLPLVDFIDRSTKTETESSRYVRYIAAFARHILDLVHGNQRSNCCYEDDLSELQSVSISNKPPSQSQISAFCERELKDTLAKNWVKKSVASANIHDNGGRQKEDEYFVLRGNSQRPITVDLSTPEKELENLVEEMRRFIDRYDSLPAFQRC